MRLFENFQILLDLKALVITLEEAFLGGYDIQKNVSAILQTLLYNVSLWEKVFLGRSASGDDVITQFGAVLAW